MVYCSDRADELVLTLPEGAAQSFKSGDPVILSSGKVIVHSAAASAVLGAVLGLGIADQDASGTTDNPIRVRIPRPGDLYNMNYQSDDTPAVADLNPTGFDLIRGASGTGQLFVDQDTTSNPKVVVLVSSDPDLPLGASSAGGPVVVRIKNVAAVWFGAN
jgi:hypothetical protein